MVRCRSTTMEPWNGMANGGATREPWGRGSETERERNRISDSERERIGRVKERRKVSEIGKREENVKRVFKTGGGFICLAKYKNQTGCDLLHEA